MQKEHTPGAWEFTRHEDEDGGIYFSAPLNAPGFASDMVTVHQEANAKLIAAAPDLLEACQHQLAALDARPYNFSQMLAAHRALQAAVTKAKGEETPCQKF